jgi:acyl-coenzyme A thioesterase 9
VPIPPLEVSTPGEQHLFDLGQKHYEAKKTMSQSSLRKVIPNEEESRLIHSMWVEGLESQPQNTVGMASTLFSASQIMQPQYRNRHNFMIFGGYLLKQTFELAFCCCAAFSHCRPTFLSLDPSTFESPVPVGSVLSLTARVAYTEAAGNGGMQTRVQVRVDSRVRNVEHREVKDAGQFNYTFLVDTPIAVMPQTYEEFMVWIEARRRARLVNKSIEVSSAPVLGGTQS